MAEENAPNTDPETTDPAAGGPSGEDWQAKYEDLLKQTRKHEQRAKANYEKAKAFDEAAKRAEEADGKAAELEQRAEKAERELAELKAERERAAAIDEVAREREVDAGLLSLMRGDTREELEASADALRAALGKAPIYPTVPDGGAAGSGGAVTREQIEAIKDPGERIRARAGWITSQNDTAPKRFVGHDLEAGSWITSQNDTAPKRPNCRNADLQSYGHTYATEFFTARMETTPNLFLGIELETEADGCAGDLATSILDAAGRTRLCCKQDSSLEDGCEVVTQPCTPAYHLTSDLWPSVLAACDGAATSHDNGRCGLHIHINRDFFGAPDERDARICTLDRLIQTHADEWTRFARRTRPQIERWCAIESDEQLGIERGDDAKTKRDKWIKGKVRFNRYKALNLSNTETVELRLWRGTLNPETLRATIEATAAIALIARNCADPEAVESWTWGVLKREMVNALGRCGLPSADLAAYLDRRGL